MSDEKSNIVFIVMDTARADAFQGNKKSATPNIDEIRSKGVSYSQAFSVAPWTLPSHASLFTGLVPSKHGAHAGHKELTQEYRLLPEILREAGYQTVAVSNNTWISEEFGFARGFDIFRKNWQYIQSDVDLGEAARTEEGWDKLRSVASQLFDGNPITNLANAVYGQFIRKRANDDGAKSTNEWVRDWLQEREKNDPIFLFINYLEPHLEYKPPREYTKPLLPDNVSYEAAMQVNQDAWSYIAGKTEMSDLDFEILEALYQAEIAYLDKRIGELRSVLKDRGEWDDTIIVVTGDHGENIGDHGFMDHQYSVYDTLLHVPLIIKGGEFGEGKTIDNLVQLTDLPLTILDAAGIEAPEFRKQTQGTSFYPDSDTDPREYVVAEYLAPQPSMEALEKRVGELSESVKKYNRSLRTIRTERWKLIRGSDGSKELYNIESDPGETRDLSDDEPTVRRRLENKLDEWIDSFETADVSGDVEMQQDTKDRLEDLGYLQ